MILKNIFCKTKYINSFQNILLKQYMCYNISVEPHLCLHDIPVSIKATDLQPNEKATVTIRTQNAKGEDFFSYAYYKANAEGCINVGQDLSQGGAYTGCLPMGLMSTLQHVDFDKRYYGFTVKSVEEPLEFTINLLPGHMDRTRSAAGDSVDYLASVSHERRIMAAGCRKLTVREGKLRGTLFLPSGQGPFPGIVDLYGSNGGLRDIRAAQLASNGIAALALAYFRYDDLPTVPKEMDLGYFEDAVHYLLRQKEIIQNGIGTLGCSKGADLAQSMGIYIKEVKAVVAINGIPANTLWPMTVNNKVIPPLLGNHEKFTLKDGLAFIKNGLNDMDDHPETILPLEKSDANFMLMVAGDDQSWHTVRENRRAVERLRNYGRTNFELVEYEDAGHYLEPPFTPFRDRIYHHIFRTDIYLGGMLNAHLQAEQLAWRKIIAFFKYNLII